MYKPTDENTIAPGIHRTAIEGLLFIERSLHQDDRGFFSEAARIPEIESVTGQEFRVKQINHARSQIHVARGIHAEGWNKLIFVTSGRCFCALADLRPDSSTFKTVETFVLGFDADSLNGTLYVPIGVGNSYVVLEGPMDYVYFVDKLYTERDPAGDAAISLFDPELDINWPIPQDQMIISERDKNCVTLKEKFSNIF